MMTRVSAVAVVAAAAALAKQTAATYVPPGGSVEDPTGAGGGGEEYEHLGCFHDSKNDRVLGDKLSSSEMTTKVSKKRRFLPEHGLLSICRWIGAWHSNRDSLEGGCEVLVVSVPLDRCRRGSLSLSLYLCMYVALTLSISLSSRPLIRCATTVIITYYIQSFAFFFSFFSVVWVILSLNLYL